MSQLPEPRVEGQKNPHVRRHVNIFMAYVAVCYAGVVGLQALMCYWLNPDDPWATLRMIIEKYETVFGGCIIVGLWVLFWEVVTWGNLIRGVLRGNIACAVAFVGIMFTGALLYLRIIL